ncbi:DMT family transporter [Xinfangfangia sp. CPCC 101601]|uniref:DMT family transporter n=1 Tax=Pseudogemmobacter lacusdianii TaxID=3069608 RepID=A0ABU0W0B6_9RHOB|nr:DMT family transporter [Xinfangfangia sp. CPCC 101601]MDQ2067459.1 DMT family transporter [Xinfangfangia sp. CPCC 101601]
MSPAALGHLAMLAFSALVAGSFSLGVLAAPHIDPALLSAWRFALSAVFLAGLAWISGAPVRKAARRAPWRWLVLGALMAAYFTLMFEGLKLAPAVQTAAVFTLTPVMAAGFGWLFLRQRTTPRMRVALALGGAGALWVIFRGDISALLRFEIGRGEVIYFWGCACHAAYAALVRKFNRGESALTSTLLTMIAGALILTLWAAPSLRSTELTALPGIVWVTLAYITIAATATTLWLVQFASLRLPAAKVMAYTYLVPSWVILWELAMHGLWPSALVGFGVALTCVALIMLLKD